MPVPLWRGKTFPGRLRLSDERKALGQCVTFQGVVPGRPVDAAGIGQQPRRGVRLGMLSETRGRYLPPRHGKP